MRTTISLDQRLLDRLKQRAAESGTTVSAIIDRAVRLLLQAPPSPQSAPFELVTFGQGGDFSSRNIDKTSSLLEAEDMDRFGPAR